MLPLVSTPQELLAFLWGPAMAKGCLERTHEIPPADHRFPASNLFLGLRPLGPLADPSGPAPVDVTLTVFIYKKLALAVPSVGLW